MIGHITCMREERNLGRKYLSGGPKGRGVFGNACLNGEKILKGFWRNGMFVNWDDEADGNDEWRGVLNVTMNLWIR